MSSASVLLVTQDRTLDEHSRALSAAGFSCYTAASYPDVVSFVERLLSVTEPSVDRELLAIVDADLPDGAQSQVLTFLRSSPRTPILTLLSAGPGPRALSEAPGRDHDEYAEKPLGAAELILRVKALMMRAGLELPRGSALSIDGSTAGVRHGEMLAVYSPRGGIGKSTLSANLGVGLTRLFGARTLVADADLAFGDIGVLLNVGSSRSVLDVSAQEDLSPTALRDALVSHASGTQLLLRPPNLVSAERVAPGRFVEILSSYTALFDYVVVDMESSLDELNLLIFEAADRVLLITTPEISSLHHTTRFLDVAGLLGVAEKLHLVVNRANSGIQVRDIEAKLGMPAAAIITSAGHLLVDAATHGVSLFEHDPLERAQITRDLGHLVEIVAGQQRTVRAAQPQPDSAVTALTLAPAPLPAPSQP